ncbi:MAG: restriction endonuclease subunit S [Candidatus Brocadia sp.]|nr:restriction endonuclease subunit S [Candidatus Brocadia sp.]
MKESKGVSYPAINPKNLVLLFICLPPLFEQRIIADFLDRETAKIDKLIEKIERQIELLKEYRQSLITSAVTGKIDVRDTL